MSEEGQCACVDDELSIATTKLCKLVYSLIEQGGGTKILNPDTINICILFG